MRVAHLGSTLPRLVAVSNGEIRNLPLAGIDTVDALIGAGPDAWEAAELQIGASIGQYEIGRLGPPLLAPSKIVAIGLNYQDHAREQGVEAPERPLVFAKFPSTITGPTAPIAIPSEITRQVDYEAELGVVVGRSMQDVSPETALEGVFGYTVANDVSARDLQFADAQWVRGKSLDTFCPLGPVIVTADEFGPPDHQRIVTRVNERLLQDSNLGEFIFDVGAVLSFLSRHFTLNPGDLVLTGTPAGVGAFREPPIWLRPGDLVEVQIEGIGSVRNAVVVR
jgi:2-keto-4-pentenoate hydratase/2-oxohepta-3-ene-1,7-dioic acid hydratase in catechol pathway